MPHKNIPKQVFIDYANGRDRTGCALVYGKNVHSIPQMFAPMVIEMSESKAREENLRDALSKIVVTLAAIAAPASSLTLQDHKRIAVEGLNVIGHVLFDRGGQL